MKSNGSIKKIFEVEPTRLAVRIDNEGRKDSIYHLVWETKLLVIWVRKAERKQNMR